MDNQFRVYALGETFDVDAFRATSSLAPGHVWRRGEPKREGCSPYPTSGIAYEIGDGQVVPFLKQSDLAIAFLKAHRDELKALGQFPGLQYSAEAQRNLVGFSMDVSSLLMWHLLDVGCRLTHYVWLQYSELQDNA